MFDGLLKPKFYIKCKSYIKATKTRLETIRKKKSATLKYLKNDVADLLLRSGLDYNAYGRAEGILVERSMLSCYDQIDEFCTTILNNISVMYKQSECPEECKQAASSLMYAAARFADLPELRDLRNLFTQKYGNSLEAYTNKEFVEKLARNPPAKDMKLQAIREIAEEFSIEWNSKALEQRLYNPPPSEKPKLGNLNEDDDGNTYQRISERDRDSELVAKNLNDVRSYTSTASRESKQSERNIDSNDLIIDSSSEDDPSSEASTRHDIVSKKHIPYKYAPPPYLKPKPVKKENNSEEPTEVINGRDVDNGQDEKPKPRSVRRRNLKPPPGLETKIDGEEADDMDGLLMYYSKKKQPSSYEKTSRGKTTYLKPPRDAEEKDVNEIPTHRNTRSEIPVPAVRAVSLSTETTSGTEAMKRHVRPSPLQPEMLGHVHPKLPDYDDLASRFAALRGTK